MDAKHDIDRSLLRFADEVKEHFAFLEALGFRCVRSEATLVRFESSKLTITVYHEKFSYEISSAIESVRGSHAYSFFETLCLVKGEQIEHYRDYATRTVEGVAEGVRQLAELLRKCVDSGILNDSELFSRLKLQREEWVRNYALDTQLEQARKNSESAWAKKDFQRVVQALAPLQEHLNPTDLKRLEYAKKHYNAST
jgi:hypothetical protein